MNPKITIITVCFNSEKFLERTIQSVISQNYENKEYIIIDGGSKDSTLSIIDKYKQHIDCIISEPDQGISDAFNKGIEASTGEIIGLINSDDFLCEDALSEVAKYYDKNVGVYRGNVLLWNINTDYRCVEKPSLKFSKIPYKIKISHQSTFIRKDVYEKYGKYDLKSKYAMDMDVLLRLYRAQVFFKHIDKTLACFTLGGLTFSKYDNSRYKEFEYILKKNGSNWFQIKIYTLLRKIIVLVSKIIPKDILLRLRHGGKEKIEC